MMHRLALLLFLEIDQSFFDTGHQQVGIENCENFFNVLVHAHVDSCSGRTSDMLRPSRGGPENILKMKDFPHVGCFVFSECNRST